MRLYLSGTRGSTPATGPDFLRYGGRTSCLAIAAGAERVPALVLDAGTGLREVTGLLDGGPFRGTIALTHLHWDHVHGLPFFRGRRPGGRRGRLLLPEQDGGLCAEAVLERGMSPPHFPIRPRDLRGRWTFGSLAEGGLEVDGLTVEAREIPHQGGRTFGYRVSDGRSTVAYLPDHCPTRLGPGPDGWGEYHPAALALARRADVLIHDAFWRAEELVADAALGHAAAEYAVGLGARAGAARVVLSHHRPDRTDDELDRLAAEFATAPVPVTVAADGEVLDL